MKKSPPKIDLEVKDKNKPDWKWNLLLYFIMLLLLWGWQMVVSQFMVRTIPYSEFRSHLAHHEITDAVVRQNEISGRIVRWQEAEL